MKQTIAEQYINILAAVGGLEYILTDDIKDFSEYWGHINITFKDNSMLIYDTIAMNAATSNMFLTEQELKEIQKLLREYSC